MQVTIDVNLDRKCRRCHKPGATQNGLCLACIIKLMDAGAYDHLFRKAAAQMDGQLEMDLGLSNETAKEGEKR